jgi:hypothetical protein
MQLLQLCSPHLYGRVMPRPDRLAMSGVLPPRQTDFSSPVNPVGMTCKLIREGRYQHLTPPDGHIVATMQFRAALVFSERCVRVVS